MNVSLDSLSTLGAELNIEHLDTVDGGVVPLIVGLMVVNTGLKGVFIYLAVTG